MALQTATNPQTGQRLALINGQWVPFTESATNPETGEKAVLVNGQWITSGQTTEQQPTPPEEEKSGFLRQALDVPVQAATGIATGVRLIADSFGADNPVSQNIRGVEDYLQGLLSAQAKDDQQEIARIMKEAEDQGIGANLRAALEAFATAPVDLIAQAAGTAVPTIAGGLAAQALKAPALLASTGVGAVMGAGTVKSSIYDEVKQTLTDLGASPEEAEKKAVLAQEYGGENLDQILLGTVIGGAAGRFGIEPAVAKQLAGNITQKNLVKAGLEEAAPEALQAAQEQVAQNVALQREGVDVPTFRGAVGAGALEAIAGGFLGAGAEAASRRFRPEAPVAEEPAPEGEAPPAAPTVEAAPVDEERAKLLADIEEVDEAAADEEKKKFEETVQKVTEGETGTALNIARTKVLESGKTAAPYIMNAVNAYLPEGMERITMSQASQIRKQLVDEGVIEGKDKVRKAAVIEPEVEPKAELEAKPTEVVTPTETQLELVDTEAKDVSAADARVATETKSEELGERTRVPVSGAAVAGARPTRPRTRVSEKVIDSRVALTPDTAERIDAGEESTPPALKTKTVEAPQEKYDSLERRLEGLRNAGRITPILLNRIRTQLKQGNPLTNPEGYEPVLKQADEIISRFETVAEGIESGESAAGIDLRTRQLKQQEQVALERAQRQIEQDRIADSLRDQYDRARTEEEILPKQARRLRQALESNDLKSVTQMLVEPASAVDAYPKKAEKYRPIFTSVARKLNQTDFSNVRVVTEATPGADLKLFKRLKDEFKLAEYDPANNTMYVRRDKVYSNNIMHELIHAGSVQTIRQYELDKSKLTDEQRLGVERLIGLYDFAQTQAGDVSLVREFPEAFDNVYEFLAYGLTNAAFQSRLARIEVSMPVGRKNIWTEFVKAVANLFGLDFKSVGDASALSELGQAFSEVLAAPTSEGVTGVSPLAERERKKAEKEPKPDINPYEETRKKYNAIREDKLTFRGLVNHLTSSDSIEELVRNYQDQQRPLLRQQTDLDRSGLAIWASGANGGNTLAAANDESAGRYQNNENILAPKLANVTKAVKAYAARTGKAFDDAMVQLDTFFTAETSDQRRLTNYLKEKPLKTKPMIRLKGSDKLISYAQLRDMLIDSVQTDKTLDDATRDAIYKRLTELAGIEIGTDGKPRKSADADKYADPLGASYGQLDKKGEARKPGKRPVDFEDPYYDIIENWDYKTNNKILADMAKEMTKFGNEIKAVRQSLVELDNLTMQFNAEANHLTQPARNLIKLYGWDKYVPMMGKVKKEVQKRDGALYLNTVPNEWLPGFRGRETAPDSPILMTQINAGRAATRAARADIVPTMVNLMNPHPKTGKKYLKGELMGVIKFTDRYKGEVNFEESDGKGGKKFVGKDKFYNYLPNGDIEVWRVDDEKIVQALRPDWTPPKGLGGRITTGLQAATSIIGQGHTRYQLKFAIYDFPRNLFANAGAISTDLGPANAAKYFAGVGKEVFLKGRLPQVWKIAYAHSGGDFAAIKKMGGFNEKTGQWRDPFVRDAYRYLERGGKVSIVRSWQTRGKLEQLIDDANKSDARKTMEKYKAAADRIFDLWLDGFELVARIEGFRVAESYASNVRKMKPEDAEKYGVSFAKNLANFEKKGLNKIPGALYAFFNPSATGAVRAFDAIMPALRLTGRSENMDRILEELPEELRNDPEAKAAYAKRYTQLKRNAQFTIGIYAGFGYMMYMMALSLGAAAKDFIGEDDEDPKNVVAEDNKELWTRNIRIPLDWLGLPSVKEKFFQIPWGFGMGAFSAVGAQVAAQTSALAGAGGKASMKDFLGNVTSIAVDSYLPLPVARYNPIDSPFNWLMSSLMPTAARPFFEYGVNMSGTGQSIYRDYYNRYGPAYAGSENIEEMYRYASKGILAATDGRVQYDPNELRYLATAYADGVVSILSDLVNIGLVAAGQKDFDPKTDLVILDSYIGNKISPSVITFNKARERIDVLKRGYDTAINNPDPAFAERFIKKYPNAPAIVYIYNQQIASLSNLREMTAVGEIYAETPKDRKNYKKEINKTRDVYMNQVDSLYKTYEEDIDNYYRFGAAKNLVP